MTGDTVNNNIFSGIPEQLPEELEQVLLSNGQLSIKRIVSKGQSSPATGWFDPDDHEWVLVVEGEGILAFEHGEQRHLQKGDYCFIPARQKHKVLWTPQDKATVWLAIHFPDQGET